MYSLSSDKTQQADRQARDFDFKHTNAISGFIDHLRLLPKPASGLDQILQEIRSEQ